MPVLWKVVSGARTSHGALGRGTGLMTLTLPGLKLPLRLSFVLALVRGTMESLQHVRALELQLQVRGKGGDWAVTPCRHQASPAAR